MDISSSSSVAATASLSTQIDVAVLKRAQQSQAQSALALIDAIPQHPSATTPTPANLPPNLGQNINVTA